MIEIREYVTAAGRSPFGDWFADLDVQAALKINTAISRLREENFSSTKSVGSGVFERIVDWGPGYRVYFAKDGDKLILLLGGGTKKRQSADIAAAIDCWKNYKNQKRE